MSDDLGYDGLGYTRTELATVMRRTYDELIDYVTRPAFLQIMAELDETAARLRPRFVMDVLLDDVELHRRDASPPEGVLIQRSAFGDRRPTLFCVKKFLPDGFRNAWENVNLTFDDEFLDASVSRATRLAWRHPLPVADQAALMAEGRNLQDA